MLRETALVTTFVELADTLVDDFDIVDLMTVLADRCVEVLDVDAAGIMVADIDGALRVLASSSNVMRMLELFELQADEGPCTDAYQTGTAVFRELRAATDDPWPAFSPRAIRAGFPTVHALPMVLRGQTIGALNLFRRSAGSLDEADLTAAQALADVATIAVLQQRAAVQASELNEQLTQALNSRVIIEQAKGVVAERLSLDIGESFERLRAHARTNHLRLVDVARGVIDGELFAPDRRDADGPSTT